MATTHKPFRELIKPGTNFEFIGRTRLWVTVSILLLGGSIAMLFVNKAVRGDYLNWNTDFKGGTEVRVAFRDAETGKYTDVSAGAARQALAGADDEHVKKGFDISGFSWDQEVDGAKVRVNGMMIRTPSYGAVSEAKKAEVAQAFLERFKDREILKLNWSGDRAYVRTKQMISAEEAAKLFAEHDLEMREWTAKEAEQYATPDEGTGEYNLQFGMLGLDQRFAKVLQDALPGVQVDIVQSYGVGATAGAKLRNDGIKSLFYAMALIMLYLAFRFDIRYAPGAVVALLHDAILVTGAFALTWKDVSLTTVAALLTVIGYSVNDTVIIFDRIRENVGRLKDKKLPRIANISINETLARTLLTALTTFFVTLMMNVFGTGMVANFAFAMNMGVIVGTYSSVFIAAPLMLYIDRRFYGGAAPAPGPKSSAKSGAKSGAKSSQGGAKAGKKKAAGSAKVSKKAADGSADEA